MIARRVRRVSILDAVLLIYCFSRQRKQKAKRAFSILRDYATLAKFRDYSDYGSTQDRTQTKSYQDLGIMNNVYIQLYIPCIRNAYNNYDLPLAGSSNKQARPRSTLKLAPARKWHPPRLRLTISTEQTCADVLVALTSASGVKKRNRKISKKEERKRSTRTIRRILPCPFCLIVAEKLDAPFCVPRRSQ